MQTINHIQQQIVIAGNPTKQQITTQKGNSIVGGKQTGTSLQEPITILKGRQPKEININHRQLENIQWL